MVSALKTAQREIHAHCQKMGFQKVEQHTQWTESDIPTLSLEERIKSAGGWLADTLISTTKRCSPPEAYGGSDW